MKFLSRKLLVFITGSVFLVLGLITGWQWVTIAMSYIGINYLKSLSFNKNGGLK